MPRRPQTSTGGIVFHVLNRGVRRMQLFDDSEDYCRFLQITGEAQKRTPVRCLSYCLMPNHFHMVLWPVEDGDLSKFMFWLLTTHSKHWHFRRGTAGTGHVYQDRFKSFPVFADGHFLRLCRYVERNALRGRLVHRAEDWPWSSLHQRLGHPRPVHLSNWPVERPPNWFTLVNEDASSETAEVRESIRRGTPMGPPAWRDSTVALLGLEKTAKPRGRPRKKSTKKATPGFFS